MAQLIAQTLGVVLGGFVLFRIAARAGVRLSAAAAMALAAVLLLAPLGANYLREGWARLDEQRGHTEDLTPEQGRQICSVLGDDLGFVAFVRQQIPERGRYYLHKRDRGGTCFRFLLLPRLQRTRLDEAQYVVFYDEVPPRLVAEVRRRGGTLMTYGRGLAVARLR